VGLSSPGKHGLILTLINITINQKTLIIDWHIGKAKCTDWKTVLKRRKHGVKISILLNCLRKKNKVSFVNKKDIYSRTLINTLDIYNPPYIWLNNTQPFSLADHLKIPGDSRGTKYVKFNTSREIRKLIFNKTKINE